MEKQKSIQRSHGMFELNICEHLRANLMFSRYLAMRVVWIFRLICPMSLVVMQMDV